MQGTRVSGQPCLYLHPASRELGSNRLATVGYVPGHLDPIGISDKLYVLNQLMLSSTYKPRIFHHLSHSACSIGSSCMRNMGPSPYKWMRTMPEVRSKRPEAKPVEKQWTEFEKTFLYSF
jgi:hypothetical protein